MSGQMKRAVRGLLEMPGYKIKIHSKHSAEVVSVSGSVYQVAEDYCSCPDWIHRHADKGTHSKHITAVRLHRQQVRNTARGV